mgnify:CR=1 FL=1
MLSNQKPTLLKPEDFLLEETEIKKKYLNNNQLVSKGEKAIEEIIESLHNLKQELTNTENSLAARAVKLSINQVADWKKLLNFVEQKIPDT